MPGRNSFISVLQVTDPHILETPGATLLGIKTAYYFNAVLDHALHSSRHFDLCLLTGDLAQEPCRASYEYLLNSLQAYDLPCLCLPGNHDDFDIMQSVLNTDNINCNKLKILGNWQIIGLNSQVPGSEGGYLSTSELAFLERCLQDNRDLNTLIAVHHHCFPAGSRWMDTMIIDNAEGLFAAIKPYPGVKAIVNGHIHQEMELTQNAVKILTTPSTCFQFKPKSKNFSLDDLSPGYRWLQLFDDGTINSGVERIPQQLEGLQKDIQGY
jgi:3',5'-cyclic-AMP phosphodiesterase